MIHGDGGESRREGSSPMGGGALEREEKDRPSNRST